MFGNPSLNCMSTCSGIALTNSDTRPRYFKRRVLFPHTTVVLSNPTSLSPPTSKIVFVPPQHPVAQTKGNLGQLVRFTFQLCPELITVPRFASRMQNAVSRRPSECPRWIRKVNGCSHHRWQHASINTERSWFWPAMQPLHCWSRSPEVNDLQPLSVSRPTHAHKY